MSLLKFLNNVSPFRPLPVDDKGSSAAINTIVGETVQLYYSNAGVLTQDAGQAAGTLVAGQLAYNNVKNALGNFEGTKDDTSLSFSAGALTTEVKIDWATFESQDETTFANRLAAICAGFSNGQYTVDYSNGTIYGKKATTATTLASTTYKYQSTSTAGAGTITSIIPGVGATNLGKTEDAAHTSGDTGVMSLGVANETLGNLSGTDGDYTPIATKRSGAVYVAAADAPVYEDNAVGVALTEDRYTPIRVTADAQIKASAGYVKSITLTPNGTITAGVITLYNNTAESGTQIFSMYVPTGFLGGTFMINGVCSTGIYAGFDGTVANVAASISYR